MCGGINFPRNLFQNKLFHTKNFIDNWNNVSIGISYEALLFETFKK